MNHVGASGSVSGSRRPLNRSALPSLWSRAVRALWHDAHILRPFAGSRRAPPAAMGVT